MPPTHYGHGRFGGPKDAHSVGRSVPPQQPACRNLRRWGRCGPEINTLARRPNGGYWRLFPQRNLAVVECLAIRSHQRTDDGMLGLMSLQIAYSWALLTPGAANHLMEELEGAFGRAGIAIRQPRSASMTPTRLSLGKWWPLATSWVPMMMSKPPLRHLIEFLAQALDGFDKIA